MAEENTKQPQMFWTEFDKRALIENDFTDEDVDAVNQGKVSRHSISDHRHPDVTIGDRFSLKNFGSNMGVESQDMANVLSKRLKDRGINDAIVKYQDGDILIKRTSDARFHKFDSMPWDDWNETLYDMADIIWDGAAGFLEGAASAAAGVAASASGPGALAAAGAAGASTASVLEGLRQKIGQGVGLSEKSDVDWFDVGLTGLFGMASPLVFGTGGRQIAQKQIRKKYGEQVGEELKDGLKKIHGANYKEGMVYDSLFYPVHEVIENERNKYLIPSIKGKREAIFKHLDSTPLSEQTKNEMKRVYKLGENASLMVKDEILKNLQLDKEVKEVVKAVKNQRGIPVRVFDKVTGDVFDNLLQFASRVDKRSFAAMRDMGPGFDEISETMIGQKAGDLGERILKSIRAEKTNNEALLKNMLEKSQVKSVDTSSVFDVLDSHLNHLNERYLTDKTSGLTKSQMAKRDNLIKFRSDLESRYKREFMNKDGLIISGKDLKENMEVFKINAKQVPPDELKNMREITREWMDKYQFSPSGRQEQAPLRGGQTAVHDVYNEIRNIYHKSVPDYRNLVDREFAMAEMVGTMARTYETVKGIYKPLFGEASGKVFANIADKKYFKFVEDIRKFDLQYGTNFMNEIYGVTSLFDLGNPGAAQLGWTNTKSSVRGGAVWSGLVAANIAPYFIPGAVGDFSRAFVPAATIGAFTMAHPRLAKDVYLKKEAARDAVRAMRALGRNAFEKAAPKNSARIGAALRRAAESQAARLKPSLYGGNNNER
jgi:hypothetical protein